jgi:hypothetical protein
MEPEHEAPVVCVDPWLAKRKGPLELTVPASFQYQTRSHCNLNTPTPCYQAGRGSSSGVSHKWTYVGKAFTYCPFSLFFLPRQVRIRDN